MDEVDEFLLHFGVKGMKWGQRKSEGSSSDSSTSSDKKADLKRVAKIVGTAAAIGAVTIGSIYVAKHMNDPLDLSKVSESTKAFVDLKLQEPTRVIYAAKPKNQGFQFLDRGGLADPLVEYDKAGFNDDRDLDFFKNYGDRNEKIALRFKDPEERKDRAGRPIFHEAILPATLAEGIQNRSQAISKVWPLVRDTYGDVYESPPVGFENDRS